MACNLVTNKARSARALMDSNILDDNLNVVDEARFNEANINKTKEIETLLGSKIPNNVFAYGLNSNFYTPNDELFYRADASEGILYPENAEFRNNFQYPVLETDVYTPTDTNSKLTELLKGIGVSVENIANDPRFSNVAGAADTFHKVVYASFNKEEVNTLPEEASHMFVEFIEQNEPSLFNKMMADIPKYGIYKAVKDEYLPIYGDLNKVKKEAIGKAISEYLVGNTVDKNVPELRTWFEKVLNKLKSLLSKFGINSIGDYNNYFEITADKILAGDFVGEFNGSGETYLNVGDSASPLKEIDARDALLTLQTNAQGKEVYFFNGREVKNRVTEKIRNKNRVIKEPTAEEKINLQVGKDGHDTLMKLWNIKVGKSLAENTVFSVPSHVVSKLRTFVDVVYNQFPGAEIRTEVKIYDQKTDTAGTIDLLITEPDGTVNILDYKFKERAMKALPDEYNDQLAEYRRILKSQYRVEKFGQIRIIPFQTLYSGKLEKKVLSDIDLGSNTLQPIEERSHLNPFPVTFETTKDERINRTLQFLNEELARNEASAVSSDSDIEFKKLRTADIKRTIAKLQITKDITSLEDIAIKDKARMESILKKQAPSPDELVELYTLKEYYKTFIENRYNLDSNGEQNIPLTEVAVIAQQEGKAIDDKLEEFFNTQDISTTQINKPLNWWSQFTQLSDYDVPAFKAFYRLINKGFAQTEVKVKQEYSSIKGIIDQIRKETGKSGVDMYEPILQKDSKGKYTNKLITKTKKEWYDMHKSVYNDTKLRPNLVKYFDSKAYNDYYKPLEDALKERLKGRSQEDITKELKSFKENQERRKGIGSAHSKFFIVPDEFLNEDYIKYVRDAPNTGLSKLYNKYIEINEFANKNADADVPLNLLPYVKKSTIEMLMNEGFNFRNLTNNALDKLKTYEWETYKFNSQGEKVYNIPLKYRGKKDVVNEDQSHDLGEMLMMWTEAVYQNSYLQETHSTAQLYQLALKKSKQIALRNGKPVLENGELRTINTQADTMQKYQEYLNMYYYGVKNEDGDVEVLGYSGNKIVTTAMKYLSGNAIGLNVFSGFANITGGLTQAISIGVKNNQFSLKQLGNAVTSLHDPKMRALFSLMDVTNNEFQQDKAINLSASKSEAFVTWDKLYVLQKGGDWLIQNSTLGAMAQNYTLKEGKIVKKTNEDEKSLASLIQFNKEGKVVIDGLDLTKEENYRELFKFREKVRRVAAEISGNTSENDKFLAGNTLKAQLFLQFRRWILPMANSRFGDLKHSVNLDEYSIGKFRSTFQVLTDKRSIGALRQYIKDQNSPDFEKILLDKYDEAIKINPNITYEEFKTLYVENIRSTIAEVIILGLLGGLMYGMDDDDPSDDSLAYKILSRGLARTASELSFWYNPDSVASILRSPVPLLGLLTNLLGLMKAGSNNVIDTITGEDNPTKTLEKGAKLIPGVSAYYKLLKEIDE